LIIFVLKELKKQKKMKIAFLVVGKTTDNALQNLQDQYNNRLKHYINFENIIIPELKNTKNLSEEVQKEKEGEQILKALDASDDVVLLDDKGKQYSSMDFSDFIQRKMNTSTRRLVFIVGGPYGFSSAVYARANGKLSLSLMTFSHQMIRLFFVEQLYRAFTILKGEPYHHE
jgi:23S rRNA (pseudouridine1915-N3)-methyltransferase